MRAFLALMLMFSTASAHDWYPRECCSGQDCAPIATPEVAVGNGGYTIKATGEFVAHKDTRISQDDQYHICRVGGVGRILCFFYPIGGV